MIIGLTGYAQSGKDTVANILVKDYGFQRVAFADKIRDLLYEMDPPVPVDTHVVGLQNYIDVYGWDEAKKHPTVRSMLQNLGVGGRTIFGENHWIVETVKWLSPTSNNYVIADVRFTNEAEWIKDMYNAPIWRVSRPGVTAVNSHISETQMDNYQVDLHLENAGTIDELESLVKSQMESLLNAR